MRDLWSRPAGLLLICAACAERLGEVEADDEALQLLAGVSTDAPERTIAVLYRARRRQRLGEVDAAMVAFHEAAAAFLEAGQEREWVICARRWWRRLEMQLPEAGQIVAIMDQAGLLPEEVRRAPSGGDAEGWVGAAVAEAANSRPSSSPCKSSLDQNLGERDAAALRPAGNDVAALRAAIFWRKRSHATARRRNANGARIAFGKLPLSVLRKDLPVDQEPFARA